MHCGYTSDDQAHFCVRCGSRFSENTEDDATLNVRFGESGQPRAEACSEERRSEFTGDGAADAALDEKKTETNSESRNGTDFSSGEFPHDGEAQEENKISAEWNGSDCRCAFGKNSQPAFDARNARYGAPLTTANGTPCRPAAGNGSYASATGPAYPPEYYAAQRQRYEEAAKAARTAGTKKTLFILSFVGLLLDFFCGIGALMCLPVAIIASVYSSKLYKEEKKTSTQLIWAMLVGYIGALLGIVFLVLMIR